MSNEPDKIIYSMIRVSKRHGQKEVLKDISLSYFYGAKIGVLGLNGAGKSSLLKILAGVDEAFDGKTVLAPGYTIGYLEQEPLAGETRNQLHAHPRFPCPARPHGTSAAAGSTERSRTHQVKTPTVQ